jgi:restriction endonuclease S subunit
MEKNQYRKEPLKDNVEEMFIGPFGSSLKNECFVDERNAYCMVYEQKHAIQKTLAGKNRFVDRNKYQELKRFTVKPGDIIVSCRGTIGETFIIPENAPLGIMHPSIMKIRLKPNVYNIEYFNLLLKSRLEAYNKSANGSGVKMAISATELGKDLFPIPPMDEQQKISRIFFMVEHLILLRKQQLAKMDELVKAWFVEMFGEPMSNPMGWKRVRFDSISENLDSKRVPVTESDRKDGIYPYYGASGIVDWISDYIFDEDILLVSEDGANLLMRSTPIAFSVSGKSWVNNHAHVVRFHDFATQKFIEVYFSLIDISEYITGTAQPKLNQAKLNAMLFCWPPLALQNQFATFVERVDQQKQTVQQSLEKLELMKKALMQEYFG